MAYQLSQKPKEIQDHRRQVILKIVLGKDRKLLLNLQKALAINLGSRINTGELTKLTKSAFHFWNEEAIEKIHSCSESSGRKYGNKMDLLDQYRVLKQRFSNFNKSDSEMKKWLNIFQNQNNFTGTSDILHLALCCFVKAPLEVTAETVGSLIN